MATEINKVLFVFGTRPEAIKMCPLVKELEKHPEIFDVKVCVTGQHREMLDQVLNIFEVRPDFDLKIMKQGQDLYDVTIGVLSGMRSVLEAVQPDVVLVHGDTTTSTAAAMAAFYKQIPVAHVEAGLRTHDIYSPWPEEMNRSVTGRIATYHFAPTKISRQNLLDENVPPEQIFVTGNTVLDALHMVLDKMEKHSDIRDAVEKQLETNGLPAASVTSWNGNNKDSGRRMVLITGHRRENFGDGFISICQAIKKLAEEYTMVDFVYPVHLNPNVRKPVNDILQQAALSNIFIISPLEYLPFVYLMNKSCLILTDSGGVQEEAPGLGKPVLVMRNTTERPEAVSAGTVKLVGVDEDKIYTEVSELLNNEDAYNLMAQAANPYGDGRSCQRIARLLNRHVAIEQLT
ncbi:non-hydrolyzing UDP-N-acetylglucosamine 2-epimerase [Chitinophaga arvensicola]|uniref:UDP-N-acetylglucosamine 2-epimerase (non-hydrolyzing) n=1 Tax=Chitinophaga arvensicola TaxID=29529 RepID=A0A1I0S8P8_9BACT|nr:UDP-N-acetylglucosamine 2-epimerase (non-hydrolyzing) [Chitinophaga arvensicola]SEW52482.1 UDP-N-acetylglucosamine 2-epimerase (non-hydrolysing) [Chitinophaga arvensicola]